MQHCARNIQTLDKLEGHYPGYIILRLLKNPYMCKIYYIMKDILQLDEQAFLLSNLSMARGLQEAQPAQLP